jgi:hypothetical protein
MPTTNRLNRAQRPRRSPAREAPISRYEVSRSYQDHRVRGSVVVHSVVCGSSSRLVDAVFGRSSRRAVVGTVIARTALVVSVRATAVVAAAPRSVSNLELLRPREVLRDLGAQPVRRGCRTGRLGSRRSWTVGSSPSPPAAPSPSQHPTKPRFVSPTSGRLETGFAACHSIAEA